MDIVAPQSTYRDIDRILLGNRVRSDLGDLGVLADSIRRVGLLFPIVVNQENVLLCGLRRLEACRKLGMRQIPVLVVSPPSGVTALDVEAEENICRKDLTPKEIDREIEIKRLASLRRVKRDQGFWKRVTRILRRQAPQVNPGENDESGI